MIHHLYLEGTSALRRADLSKERITWKEELMITARFHPTSLYPTDRINAFLWPQLMRKLPCWCRCNQYRCSDQGCTTEARLYLADLRAMICALLVINLAKHQFKWQAGYEGVGKMFVRLAGNPLRYYDLAMRSKWLCKIERLAKQQVRRKQCLTMQTSRRECNGHWP